MELGYVCQTSGRTIRAWEEDGVVYVCLADVFMCLDLEEQKIEECPKMVNGELCVTNGCFLMMINNSTEARTAGTSANEFKQYLWSLPGPLPAVPPVRA